MGQILNLATIGMEEVISELVKVLTHLENFEAPQVRPQSPVNKSMDQSSDDDGSDDDDGADKTATDHENEETEDVDSEKEQESRRALDKALEKEKAKADFELGALMGVVWNPALHYNEEKTSGVVERPLPGIKIVSHECSYEASEEVFL